MVQCSADNLPAKTGLRWTNKHLMLLVYWQTAVELPQTDHLLFQSFFSPLLSLPLSFHCSLHGFSLLPVLCTNTTPFRISFTYFHSISLLYYRVSFFNHFFFSFYISTEVMFLRFLCCLCASCFLCTRWTLLSRTWSRTIFCVFKD